MSDSPFAYEKSKCCMICKLVSAAVKIQKYQSDYK